MTKILIIGAGAIGRGYLPWVFKNIPTEFHFIDSNQNIINELNSKKSFSTFRAEGETYTRLRVEVGSAKLPTQFLESTFEIQNFDAIFVSVGPRHITKIISLLEKTSGPIILCENDPATVTTIKSHLGAREAYFAVPDVITSNTAPAHLLKEDPLAISTEVGELFIDQRVKNLPGEYVLISEDELLSKQWTSKLFLHNTPHCIAAYLGALANVQYVHQAMEIPAINKIVEGSMLEMLVALKQKWDIPHSFLEWYAEKELSRFRNKLLFDPIARVAREPLRKLELDGRLIGAAQICLALGFVPQNILLGIASALLFDNPSDNDRHLAFMQRALTPTAFLTHVLGLRQGEALEMALKPQLPNLISKLQKIAHEARHGN